MNQIAEEFSFESNLVRRVENFSLSPNVPTNPIVPIFEAVYNSLQSVLERFGSESWGCLGAIRIKKLISQQSIDVEIVDNGEGFNEINFKSFLTYDSPKKKKIHGKGIGRISWLKVFEKVKISSIFEENGKFFSRKFDFVFDEKIPIRNHTLIEVKSGAVLETRIELISLRTAYHRHFPSALETFANRIIAHFNFYFLSGECPAVSLSDGSDEINIKKYVFENRMKIGQSDFDVEDSNFKVDHYLVEKKLGGATLNHLLQFSGAQRIVTEKSIGAAVGLATYIERDGRSYFYNGIIHSDFLDQCVVTERTTFDIDRDILEEINRKAINSADEYLQAEINKLIQRQSTLVDSVVKKFPRYSYLVKDNSEFVRSMLPRNARNAESVYTQLSILDFRETRKIEREIDAKTTVSSSDYGVELDAGIKALIAKVSDQEKSSLAEYTAKRKLVLDILDKRLGYQANGEMKHHSEEAVHALICPVRKTSFDITADEHNLWILDDKLTYYNFWASDKRIKEYVKSDSNSRPDIALFSGKTLFHRESSKQPVVIVEFKRPARDNYDYEENPILQIYDYIEDLRGSKVFDKDGKIIDDIEKDHPFFCYVIADLTTNLRKYLKATQINFPLPGSTGFYGFNSEYNAYIQVLNWRHVVSDARLRNEAFFKHLKI